MHILVESQFFYPEQMRINDICTALVERGHTITAVTSIPNYPQGKFYPGYGLFKRRKETHAGMTIHHLPVIPRGKGFIGLTLNYISFVVSGWFFAHFTKIKPDIVFMNMSSPMTQSLVGTWIAKRRRIPSIIYILDLWPESFEVVTGISSPMLLKPLGNMVDKIYGRVDQVLTSSKSFIDSINARGVLKSKLEFWPQYAEAFYKPVSKPPSTETLLIPCDQRLKIIFTGNVGLAQGLDLLIPTAQGLKAKDIDVCFVIVGDGSYKAELIRLIEDSSLQSYFHFIDRQPATEIPLLLSQADAGLVMLKKSEIFSKTIPAKVQSYMACALPLIVSADGEVQDVVREANAGLVAPAEDTTALTEAIAAFSALSKAERDEMGMAANAYSNLKFNKENLINRLEHIMQELYTEYSHVH
jgi:glycosyltransferase involved in cell wall biosynthesis